MITATAKIRGTAPYSQSKVTVTERDKEFETADDHEKRTWRERMHVNDDGFVFIPPTALKNCIAEAAKYLSMKIPSKANATYTKHFEAGVMCLEPIVFPIKAAEVESEKLHVPADGRRGGSKRVWKYFPYIPSQWTGEAVYMILDPLITEEVFTYHLKEAGNYIGIGRFRPRNNGFYGRFIVESVTWKNGNSR